MLTWLVNPILLSFIEYEFNSMNGLDLVKCISEFTDGEGQKKCRLSPSLLNLNVSSKPSTISDILNLLSGIVLLWHILE